MIRYTADSADALWNQARLDFRHPSKASPVEGRTSVTWELRPAFFELTNPRNRWVLSRVPVVSPAGILSEVIWIMCGRNDAAFVNFWNNKLSEYAGPGETYYGAYGHRLRKGFGVDQLVDAAQALRSKPESRQVCLSIWDPRLDLPVSAGQPRSPDIPCNVLSLLKVREGRLEWTQIMRSNDFWLGFPINVVQFTVMQEILAGWIGVDVGRYHHVSDSLHLYPIHKELLNKLKPVKVLPPNSDDFTTTGMQESLNLLDTMATLLDVAVDEDLECDWASLAPDASWPDAYANLHRIVLADAARRRKNAEAADILMRQCSNPILSRLWQRWIERVG